MLNMAYECRDFGNEPQGRAVVRVDKLVRADSGGHFCVGLQMAASHVFYRYSPDLSCGRDDCTDSF